MKLNDLASSPNAPLCHEAQIKAETKLNDIQKAELVASLMAFARGDNSLRRQSNLDGLQGIGGGGLFDDMEEPDESMFEFPEDHSVPTEDLFALTMGDFMISGSNLEGASPTTTVNEMTRRLEQVHKTPKDQLFVPELHAAQPEIGELQHNFEEMKQITNIQESFGHKQSCFLPLEPNENPQALALKIADKVRQLKPGQFVLIPGGWAGGSLNGINGSGHFIGYAINKQKDGKGFEFIPVNTGYGISAYHGFIQNAAGNKDLYATDISLRNIPESLICGHKDKSAGFLTGLMEISMGRLEVVEDHFTKKTRTIDDAVKTIYELMWKLTGQTTTLSNKEKEYQTPQRAGTCTWKPLKTMVKLKLGSVTSRRLILETDMQSLQYHLNCWKSTLDKAPTKRVLLIEINKKMARRTVKLLEDNIISFATAEKVYQQIQKNQQILKPYYQDLNIEPNELKAQADEQFNQVLQKWHNIHNSSDIEQRPASEKELRLQPVVLKKCDTLVHIHYNLKTLNQALEHILPNATQHPQKAEALLRHIQYCFNALPSSNFDAVFKDITAVKPREMNLALLELYENFLKLNATVPHPAGSKAVVSAQVLMYMHKLGMHDDKNLKRTSIPAIKRIIDIALHTPTYVPDAQELKTLYNLRQEAVRLMASNPVPLASQISMEQSLYINVSLEPKEALAALAQPAEVEFYEKILKENPQLKYQCRGANSIFLKQSEAVQHMADLALLIQNDEKPSSAGLMPENLASLNALKRAIRLACLTSTHDVDLHKVNKNQGQLLSDAQMQLSGMPIQQVRFIIGNKPISTHFYKKNFSTTAYQFEDKKLEHISMGVDKAYSEHNEFENLFEEYTPNRKQKNENELQIQHPNKQNVNQYLHLSRVYKEDALTHAMVVNFYLENMTLLSNPDHQHTLELALLRSKPDQNKPSQGYLESQIKLNSHTFANSTVELLHSAALYFNDKNDTKTLLFISKLSQLTAAHFKAYGIPFSLDQSTTAILKKIKKEASPSEQAMINALTAIQLQYENTSVSNLSAMIRYGFHSVFYKENGSVQHNQVESQLFKMLFKMQPYFQQLLKSSQMDKILAQTLQSLKLPATGKEKVSGTWPLIKFGEYTFDFNRFTVIRKGLDLHLQIPSTLLHLPDFKQLMHNKSMEFEVKDQIYTFKKHHLSFDLNGKTPVIKKVFKLGQENLSFRLVHPSEDFKDQFPFIGNDYHLWQHEQRLIATHKESGQLIQLTTKNGSTRITSGQSMLMDLRRAPAFMTHIEEPDNIRAWYKNQQLQKIDLPHFGESFSLKDGDPSRLRWDKDIRYVLNSKPSPLFGHFRQYIELVNAENQQDRIVLFPQGKPLSVRNRNDSGREPAEVIIAPYSNNPKFYVDGTQNYTNSKSMYAIKMNHRGQLLAQTPEEHLAAASIAYRLHHYKDALQHVNKAISDQPFSLDSQHLIAEMFRPISTGLDLNASTSTLGMSNNHPNAFAFRLQLVAALAQNGVNKPDKEMAHILKHYALKTKIELVRYVETINNVDASLRLTTQQLKAFQALDDNPTFDGMKIVTGKAERFINQVAGDGKIESAHKQLKQKESDKIIKDKDANKVQGIDYGIYAFPQTLPKPKKGTIDLLSNRKLMSKNEWFTTLRSLSVLSPNENELQKLASALVWLAKDLNTDEKQEIADRMKFYSFAFDDDINFHKLYLTTAISAMAHDTKSLDKICPENLRDELNGLQPAPKVSMTKTFADSLAALNGINEPHLFGLPQGESSDFDAMSLSVKSLNDGDTLMTDAPAISGSNATSEDMKSALYYEKLSDKNKALHDFFYSHYEQNLKLDDIKLVTPPVNSTILYKTNKAKATELLKPIQFGPILLSRYLNASFDQS
ncbi:MAG TPA: hypothetical protein DDW29_05650, partial [Gammaproteobacteria bacterium]|nr:hypothetical protein [Gammaproteobacteria bacterium]